MEGSHRRWIGVVVLVASVALTALVLSPEVALARLRGLADRPLVFGIALGGLYLLRPFVAWPISLCSALAGAVYGVALGTPIALCGVALTCLPPYLLARRFGRDAGLFGRLGEHGERAFAATGVLRGVIAARLAPVPAELTSAGAGLAGVSLGPYLAGTLIGEVPWTIAATLAGSSVGRLTAAGLGEAAPRLVLAAGALALVILAGPAYRLLRGRGRVTAE